MLCDCRFDRRVDNLAYYLVHVKMGFLCESIGILGLDESQGVVREAAGSTSLGVAD